MEENINVFDANSHLTKDSASGQSRVVLRPSDDPAAAEYSWQQDHFLNQPPKPKLEASAFAFITSVLMSGALVAAVGALIKAFARFIY
jgi:hypothetical protein